MLWIYIAMLPTAIQPLRAIQKILMFIEVTLRYISHLTVKLAIICSLIDKSFYIFLFTHVNTKVIRVKIF